MATEPLTADDFAVIPTESIRPAAENRRFVDDEAFRALVSDISQRGVLQPLWVRPLPEDEVEDGITHELVAGERRWSAAVELELDAVPCLVIDYDDDGDRLAAQFAENYHRRDLSTMDKARHVGYLVDLGLSQREIAEKLSISQGQVSKLASMLKLPEKAQQWVDEGRMSQEDAVRLAGLPDEAKAELMKADRAPVGWQIDSAAQRIERAKAFEKAKKAALAKGWTVIDYMPEFCAEDADAAEPALQLIAAEDETCRDGTGTLDHVLVADHESEPCHAVFITSAAEAVPACLKPERHPRPADWEPPAAEAAQDEPTAATASVVPEPNQRDLADEAPEDHQDRRERIERETERHAGGPPLVPTSAGEDVLALIGVLRDLITAGEEVVRILETMKVFAGKGAAPSTNTINGRIEAWAHRVSAAVAVLPDPDEPPEPPTITFAFRDDHWYRTCSEHGRFGATQSWANALQLAREHLEAEHGGAGEIVEPEEAA